jgi:Family of unknown function (DUF6790)
MDTVIRLALENSTVVLLVLGIVVAGVRSAVRPRPVKGADVIEDQLAWFLFFSIGVSYFYNFVVHTFFGEMTARFIGWEQSPFQAEVGFASLGFSLVGFMAFRGGLGLRVGAVVGPACFLWGAAGGHIYQMVVAHNFAPGNAGAVFWTDVILPIVGFTLLGLCARSCCDKKERMVS